MLVAARPYESLRPTRAPRRAVTLAASIAALVLLLAAPSGATAYVAESWGSNAAGQLGNASAEGESDVPVAVSGLYNVTGVSSGGEHSLALVQGGNVMAWGENVRGQLGSGTFANSNVPVQVSGLRTTQTGEHTITAISAGGGHSLALERKLDGLLQSWGSNESGQLGNKSTEKSDLPVEAKVPTKSTIGISAGGEHSLALTEWGSVMAWGDNEYGELGNGSEVEQSLVPVELSGLGSVSAVSAGGAHSLALINAGPEGRVMAWGDNASGQLGNGTTTSSSAPVEVGGLSGVIAISAGGEHNLALLSNGTVMAWGDNAQGQLGNGTFTNSDVPVPVSGLSGVTAVAAGGEHSLALLNDGTVRAWGGNHDGQLGDGGEEDSDVPVAVSGLGGVVGIAAGQSHSLAFGSPPPPPTVSAIGPQEGSPSGGTSVVIAGTNLNLATAVYFGSLPAKSFTVDSPGFLTAVSPPGAGTVDVTVASSGGWSSTGPADQFSYLPKVTEVNPVEGLPSGGSEVTITGTNLALASAVKFGSTSAVKFTVNSDTSIVAVSPPGSEKVDVTVTTPGGTSATSPADQFSYALPAVGPAPSVSGVSPSEGPAPGGTSVTLTGKNFTGTHAVKFGSSSATAFAVNSEGTSITAVSPPGVGTVDVTVRTPAGTSATGQADQFSYKTSPPTVTSVEPKSSGAVAPEPVRIIGTNFFRPTSVEFAGVPAERFTAVSESTILAVAPASGRLFFCMPKSGHVTVTTPGGTSAPSAANEFWWGC